MLLKLLPALAAALLLLPLLDGGPERGAARIVDGDTLRLSGETIRLHGIDAPEMAQDCTDAAGRAYACGESARLALARLAAGDDVTCAGAERDRYGRLLAVCRAGGTDLNRAMVEQGWALAFRRYSDDYAATEDAARAAGRGLWAGRFAAPWDWRAARREDAAADRVADAEGCRIKGNVSSSGRIYHLPGTEHYDATQINPARGERWFCTEAEAVRAGWRAPRG